MSAEQLFKAASATSQNELLIALKECNSDAIYTFHAHLFDAVIKAVDLGNIETAKKLAVIYDQTGGIYEQFKQNYESILVAFKDLSWVSFIDSWVTVCKRPYYPNIWGLGRALLKQHIIQLEDFARRPIRSFTLMLDCFCMDPEVIYKIMTENSLSRSDRLNMLGLMKRYDKLTLQPCGPEKLSPLIYCLKLRRIYLMKYFTDIPRKEQLRGPNGENFLAYASEKHPFMRHLKLFTKDELKSMLIEKHLNNYVLDLLATFKGGNLANNTFLTAVKELLMEGQFKDSKEVDAPKLIEPKFIYHYSGIIPSNPSFKDDLNNYYDKKEKMECIGETTFSFEELPVEIFQLICEELNSRAITALLLTSKSLHKFSERFDSRFFERLMRKNFMMVYGFKSTDQSQKTVDWKNQFNLHSRRVHGWCTKDPKILRIDTNSDTTYADTLYLDEHWLISNRGYNSKTLFWNVNEHKLHVKIGCCVAAAAHLTALLDSPEFDLPTLIAISPTFTTICDYNIPNGRHSFPKAWDSNYVAPVSRTRFISGKAPELFDIEMNKTLAKNNTITNIYSASHNKLTQMTAMSSLLVAQNEASTYVLDKNMEITHYVQENKHTCYSQITWLDEFKFLLKGYSGIRIADIRMHARYFEMEKITSITLGEENRLISTGTFTSHHSLHASAGWRLGYVWNMKDFTWSNVVVLPDDVRGSPRCNSRYAAFSTDNSSFFCLTSQRKK